MVIGILDQALVQEVSVQNPNTISLNDTIL